MSLTIESQGAVKFYKPRIQLGRSSITPCFDEPESDVESGDPKWEAVIETVSSFASLDDDWDGSGAVAPQPALVHMAVELARHLKVCDYPAPSRAIAGVNGTISFEYTLEPFTEIEIVSPDKAEVFEKGRLKSTLHADSGY